MGVQKRQICPKPQLASAYRYNSPTEHAQAECTRCSRSLTGVLYLLAHFWFHLFGIEPAISHPTSTSSRGPECPTCDFLLRGIRPLLLSKQAWHVKKQKPRTGPVPQPTLAHSQNLLQWPPELESAAFGPQSSLRLTVLDREQLG